MLGIGLELINKVEFELKKIDYAHTERVGRKPLDEELATKVAAASKHLVEQRTELEDAERDSSHHFNSMEVIEATQHSAGAVEAGRKAKSRARSYVPLPLEEEYRAHRVGYAAAVKASNKFEKAAEKALEELIKLWSGDRGPFEESFLRLMQDFNFQRQAYHSSALNGNDIHRAFQPDAVKAFSDLLRPRLGCCTIVQPDGQVKTELFFSGNDDRADQYFSLFSLYGEAASLHGRIEPLCDHEQARFRAIITQLATLYADMFPLSAPGPKLHAFLSHAADQIDALGGAGFLTEAVVESIHVIDNRMQRRDACIRDIEANLLCRMRHLWELSCPSFESVRDASDIRSDRKRRTINFGARKKREAYANKQ